MRDRIYIMIISVLAISSFSGTGPDMKFFTFRILQDSIEVQVKHKTIKLNKKPFVIEVSMSAALGIFVNASFEERSYKISKSKRSFTEIPGFRQTGMAEADFNRNKEIMVSVEAPNYWYYETEKSHRFDEVKTEEGWFVCTRSIEKVYNVDTKKTFKIEEVTGDLYLVFLVKQRGKSQEADTQLQRESLAIKWN